MAIREHTGQTQELSRNSFLIIGTQRSGTSLLARILNQHPKLAVPPESFFFNTFVPLLRFYGDLSEDKNLHRFIDDVLAASDSDSLATLLAQRLSEDASRAKLLAKWLKKIKVTVLRLSDFQPTKSTVEKGDVEQVVGEFRSFLETAFEQDEKQQSVIVEFKK